MASQWFCKVLGQEVGPVGFGEMAEMVRAGTLKEDDLVRREGTTPWTRAGEVIGLFRTAAKEATQATPDAKAEPRPVRAPAKTKEAEPPAERRRRFGRRRALLAAALVVVLVLLVAGVSTWRATRRERFPEPRPRSPVVEEDGLKPLIANRSSTAVGISVHESGGERAALERKVSTRNRHAFPGVRAERREEGGYRYRIQSQNTSSEALSGWMRLVRVGSRIRHQIAGPHTEQFVQIHEAEFPPSEVTKVLFKAQPGDSPTAVDVVWSYFDVQAEEIVKEY